MMVKGWAVMGTTGEYSDRTEWIARVFVSEVAAKAHADALNAECRRLRVHDEIDRPRGKRDEAEPELRKLDPKARIYYSGVSYYVEDAEVDLPTCEEHDDCRAHPEVGAACLAARSS